MVRFGLAALTLTAIVWVGPLTAEEQNFKYHLVTIDLTSSEVDVPNADGHRLDLGKYAGVAVFEDGRIAFKEFVYAGDNTKEGSSGIGYSTYTFQNGDMLNFRFSYEGSGGDYELISGTGAYEGASGTGRFDWIVSNWENATEWEASWTLDVPES